MLEECRLQNETSQRVEELTKEEANPNIMDEMLAVAKRAKENKYKQQNLERNRKSFGQGLKKGFFNTAKPATTKKISTPHSGAISLEPTRQQSSQRDENLLIVKHKDEEPTTDDSAFVFPEVQKAMRSINQLDPKEWINERFYEKLARNPKLVQALQNPAFSTVISELQQNPGAAVLKYQKDPAMSTILREFLEFLGNHFEEIGAAAETVSSQVNVELDQPHQVSAANSKSIPAIVDLDETRRHAIAGMQRTPDEEKQVQNILKNPELMAALSDKKLMQRLHECQKSPQDLKQLTHDPVLGPKLQLLIQHKMVHFV